MLDKQASLDSIEKQIKSIKAKLNPAEDYG
ncbi:MAG: hypothetical protein JWQ40_2016 [Segetibacter sp.]|nr:hypothetical protein [Segetibacter sp.]